MENLDVVEFLCFRHDTAEDHLVRETGGPMFLIEVLALCSHLYRNGLALEVRIDDYGTLLHVGNILEVNVTACIREGVDLVCMVDSIAKGLVFVEGLLPVMSPVALTADVVSVLGVGKG